MSLSIEGNRTRRKGDETFKSFRSTRPSTTTKLLDHKTDMGMHYSTRLREDYFGGQHSLYGPSSSRSRRDRGESSGIGVSKTSSVDRPYSRGSNRTPSSERQYLNSSGSKSGRHEHLKTTKERRLLKSQGYLLEKQSRPKSMQYERSAALDKPLIGNLEESLESITLSDYMSNLLKKNSNTRHSTPQSDFGSVSPLPGEQLDAEYMDPQDSSRRLRSQRSRKAMRQQQQQSWLSKDIEMDFRPATATDQIARTKEYDDPQSQYTIDTATTKEVDLSSLSAQFFSPTKKKSSPEKPRDPFEVSEHRPEKEVSFSERIQRKPQSARAMLEGWQKKMREMERPPSRQRPPPESLHLYAEGFATLGTAPSGRSSRRPATAASPSRSNKQNYHKAENETAFFSRYDRSQNFLDKESLKSLKHNSAVKHASYDYSGRSSRRGRKKRVKEAFVSGNS